MPKGACACRVLLVDDEADLRWLLAGCLTEAGFEVVEAGNAREALERYSEAPAQVVVSDVRMPGESGVTLLQRLHELDARLPVVLISALEDVATAVDAMKLGAYDYLTKPFDNDRLLTVVRRALETQQLKQEVARLRTRLGTTETSFGISVLARELEKQARLVASTPGLSALLQGESGTGKEILARTIHELSPRAERPFVAVDCGALPEPLLESLLFGHERGAFTGADQRKDGLFVEADQGTLFLDELGNLPLGLQAKLLRALQEREVRPLGSDKAVGFDVRLIAAGNTNLLEETQHGRFRLDLYHRVAEFVLHIPPLRERPEDIPHFTDLFLHRIAVELDRPRARLSDDAAARLAGHDWPGNLRELLNVLRRATLLGDGGPIPVEAIAVESRPSPASAEFRDGVPLKDQVQSAAAVLERNWIRQALLETGGNKAAAARRLGVDYTTLHRKLKRYGLDTMADAP